MRKTSLTVLFFWCVSLATVWAATSGGSHKGIVITLNAAVVTSPPPQGGAFAYWKFNEGTGTVAVDSSGNNNTLTLTNGATWSTNPVALDLDGTNDLAYTPTLTSVLNGDVTVTAWIKWTGGGGNPPYIFGGNAPEPFLMWLDKSLNRVCIADSNAVTSVCSANNSISQNVWTFVAASRTWNGSVQQINVWVGSTKYSGTLSTPPAAGSTRYAIGNMADAGCGGAPCGTNRPFKGQINHVRFFAYVVSDTDIQTLSQEQQVTTPQVATPVITPSGGSFVTGSPQTVTITTTTSGAAIYYTVDGTTPTTSSPLYSGAFSVSTTQTIRAIAVKASNLDSALAAAAFTFSASGPCDSGVSVAPCQVVQNNTIVVNSAVVGNPAVNGEWQHLKTAIATATPGTVVQVKNGTYNCPECGSAQGGYLVAVSGTSVAPITITNYPGHTPTISTVMTLWGRWLIIKGLRFSSPDTDSLYGVYRGETNVQKARHITIEDNVFENGGYQGMYVNAVMDLLVQRNTFSKMGSGAADCGGFGGADPNNLHNTVLRYVHCHGLYFSASAGTQTVIIDGNPVQFDRVTIRRNKFLNNYGHGWTSRTDANYALPDEPIHYLARGRRAQNWLVENNLFVNNGLGNGIVDLDNSVIRNNTYVVFTTWPSGEITPFYNNHMFGNVVANNVLYYTLTPQTYWNIHSWNSDSTVGNTWSKNYWWVTTPGWWWWGGINRSDFIAAYATTTGDNTGQINVVGTNGTGSEVGWVNPRPLGTGASAVSGDFHLSAASPLIDAADQTQCPTTDIEGTVRAGRGTGCDVGAYEF